MLALSGDTFLGFHSFDNGLWAEARDAATILWWARQPTAWAIQLYTSGDAETKAAV